MLWLQLDNVSSPAGDAIAALLPGSPIGREEGGDAIPIVEVDPYAAADPWPEAQAVEADLRARAAAGERHPVRAYPFHEPEPVE